MTEVIGVGIATIDVIHEVAAYPEDPVVVDAEVSRRKCGERTGCLGGRCRWLGMSTDPTKDSEAAFIHEDLSHFGVDCSLASVKEGSMPISHILSSRETGSRTIVHSRNLAELSYKAFVKQLAQYHEATQNDTNKPVWVHFEGRNVVATEQMMLHVRTKMTTAKISVEIEALRNGWDSVVKLIAQADYVFLSKEYIREKLGFPNAQQFFEAVEAKKWGSDLTNCAIAFICPWGDEGVYYLDVLGSTEHHVPATRLDKAVETIGAGDAFIGASLAGFSRGIEPMQVVLKTACEVASGKCLKQGFELVTDDLSKWKQILQGETRFAGTNAA
ncbi:hypothetical protein PHMEG_00015507 [Phytophthora megakarya]|uniref:Carbohydrate kinase PfkB domain-containing protein n=1 Tax=Phytophthora megakarya TaxID=4795 RepID=A0A225W3N7_9STRA|nr:hypothetical protein PHMEG_00015507 [Phytophthora megakarya]